MAIFEGFFGKRGSDSGENLNQPKPRNEESRAPAFNNEPREPILPDRAALEAEADELFVKKSGTSQLKPQQSFLSDEERIASEREATQEIDPQQAAMTKARTEVLDLLTRIEKAGLPIPPELRAAVRNELVKLAAEAARIEFQEAKRADPIVILRSILKKLSEKKIVPSIRQSFQTALEILEQNAETILREFQIAREALTQQGVVDPVDAVVLGRMSEFQQGKTGRFPVIRFNLAGPTVQDREGAAAELLKELGVFAAGDSLSLADLFTAIQKTGRTKSAEGEPYYSQQNVALIGLSSKRPELKGLTIDIASDYVILINLNGDSSFWLRFIKSARTLEKNP